MLIQVNSLPRNKANAGLAVENKRHRPTLDVRHTNEYAANSSVIVWKVQWKWKIYFKEYMVSVSRHSSSKLYNHFGVVVIHHSFTTKNSIEKFVWRSETEQPCQPWGSLLSAHSSIKNGYGFSQTWVRERRRFSGWVTFLGELYSTNTVSQGMTCKYVKFRDGWSWNNNAWFAELSLFLVETEEYLIRQMHLANNWTLISFKPFAVKVNLYWFRIHRSKVKGQIPRLN